MDYLDNLFMNIKLSIAGFCFLYSAITLVIGFVIGNFFTVFTSVLFMFLSLFVAFDGTKVHSKIKNEVNKIRTESNELKVHNITLGTSLCLLESENSRLSDSVNSLDITNSKLKDRVTEINKMYINAKLLLKNLSVMGDSFTDFNKEIGNSANELQINTKELDDTQQELEDTQEDLEDTQEQLTKTVSTLELLISKLGLHENKKLATILM